MHGKARQNSTNEFQPARITRSDATPWVPLRDGVSFRPLRFLPSNKAYTALLRLEPGRVIKLHRHTGQIHAYNVDGVRKLCTGETVGPGDYVYEPPGNVDTWRAVGDVPLIIFIVVEGVVEYLGAHDEVIGMASCDTQLAAYREYCRLSGTDALDLVE